MLEKVRTVLIHNSHPGNIGSSARALKNMGLSSLYLVAPKEFPSKKALYMASRAEDIVENAVVVEDLASAISDCSLVLGASSRKRALPWPEFNPLEAAEKVLTEIQKKEGKVAILYGCEQHGLSNEELEATQGQIIIEALPSYASLNVAQAVLLISYEIYRRFLAFEREGRLKENEINTISQVPTSGALSETPSPNPMPLTLASQQELQGFYQHLQETLVQIKFMDETRPGHIISRLKRLFSRAGLDKIEVNILRGILTAMQKSV